MKIQKIQQQYSGNFKENTKNKKEFIDILVDNVKNPRDVQDCVAVPRGIFKAYIYLMIGSSLGMISGALPQKWKFVKTSFSIACAIFSAISAVYFAKPFAIKGLSPTLKTNEISTKT